MAAHRLRLDPSFRPIVRSSGIVQLGATAESGGILLTGLSAGEIALLDRLDGSLSETELYAAARATGVPHRRAGELLAVLRHHGVLLADQVATSRPGQGSRIATAPRSVDRLVVVDGTGPLAMAVASVLRVSRIGRIHTGAWAADAGRGRSAADRVGRTRPCRARRPGRREPAGRRALASPGRGPPPGRCRPRSSAGRSLDHRRPRATVPALPAPHPGRAGPGSAGRVAGRLGRRVRRAARRDGRGNGGDGGLGRTAGSSPSGGRVGRDPATVAQHRSPALGPAYRVSEPRARRPGSGRASCPVTGRRHDQRAPTSVF